MGIWEDLIGQDKSDLQGRIEDLEKKLETATGAVRDKYMQELNALKGQYEQQMKNQGAVDQYGRLVEAKDVQNKYLDQDYLTMRRNQGQESNSLALAQTLKGAKQNSLKNQGPVNPAQVASAIESAQRNTQNSLANDVRGETLRAKGEASQELQNKQNYVTNLTNSERQNIMDRLTLELQSLGLQGAQLQNMINRVNAMPDGMLQQIVEIGSGQLVKAIMANA